MKESYEIDKIPGGLNLQTKIFYFSATGNSLAVARSIAAGIGEAELVSIPGVMAGEIDMAVPKIGLVFPVYAYGMPRIVADFVRKLKLDKNNYVFAVATGGGTPANTLIQLRRLLRKRGGDLDAGFAVKEANHTPLSKEDFLIKSMSRIAGKQPLTSRERLPEIIEVIKNNRKHRSETSSRVAGFIGDLLYKMAIATFKTADRDFLIDEKCGLCQTCIRICPRQNIKIEANKPTWHHNCESCFACLEWCPNEAIQYKNVTQNQKRSHHPGIKVSEVILR